MYNAYRLLAMLFLGPVDSRSMLREALTRGTIESPNNNVLTCNDLGISFRNLLGVLREYVYNDELWREFNIDYTGCTQPKPGGTECYIYESVYATRDSGRPTINDPRVSGDLVRYYKMAGLEPSGIRSPDHISVELDYLAALHMIEAEALQQNNIDLASHIMGVRKQFISQHISRWVPEMIECILKCAHSRLLRVAVENLRILLACEEK